MAPKAAVARAAELRTRLEEANHRYHVLDDPQLSDADYDALLQAVAAGNAIFPRSPEKLYLASAWRERRPSAAVARQGPSRQRGSSRRRFVGDAADRSAERGGSGTERVDAQAARSKALRPPLEHGLNGLGRRVEQVVRDLQQ